MRKSSVYVYAHTYAPACVYFIRRIKRFIRVNCKQVLKRYVFKQLFCEKIWRVSQKAIPLHPLSRTNDT